MDPAHVCLPLDTVLNQLSIPTMTTAKNQKYVKATDQQLKIKAASGFNPIKII